jgi:N,N-dimethylformamidase
VTYDANQRFLSFVPGGNGVLYAIQSDGALLWYQNTGWATGAQVWSGGSSRVIGSGWQQFTTVLANSDGQIFALRPDGTLLWYKYKLTNSSTGAGTWDPASGSVIGAGFNRFARIFGGWDGVIYGEDSAGNLYWYRYAAGNGTNGWGANTGALIGDGWNQYPWLFADPNGVVYGVRQGGQLAWWRYIVPNVNTGLGHWANGGNAIFIGTGWGDVGQKTAWSNTSGAIYAVVLDGAQLPQTDNVLTWFRLRNSETIDTSGISWYNGGNATTIGNGFTQQGSAALQGYPSTLSTTQGGSVGVQVSTTWPQYTASVVRLAPSTGTPVTVVPAASHAGRLQMLPNGYRSNGCGWSTDFTVATDNTWQSGIYSAQLLSGYGNQYDTVFVVRPSVPKNKVAVILATNTYQAYNTWGGHDQYTNGQAEGQRNVSILRPNVTTQTKSSGYINHTLYSDLMLYTWMTSNNIAYDVYTDADVDATGATWMSSYKAVVTGSHSEYWSQTARQNLVDYLAGGGRAVTTGGNNLYEQVSYSADGNAVIFRTPTGDRNLFEDIGEFSSDVLGIIYNAATYMDFYPYQVQNAHPFLNGTGLSAGDTFGGSGYNVAASGWEVDWAVSGVPGLVVIAEGQNPNGGGSMCYVPRDNGGWVFTTGSITFNGSIQGDPAIQQILRNVFAAAVL